MKTIRIWTALLLFTQFAGAQDRVAKIDSLLNALYAEKSINGNFLVAEKGNVIYKKSFGLANERTNEKLDENSIFELASVSKQFTAMAIMILSEKGKLNLDDDFSTYLPELSHYKGITVRNLLHHTGGLPDYMNLMDSLSDKTKIVSNKDIIAVFAKHKPAVVFKPNTKFEYSNTGYALLGSIIEKTSGKSFGDYLAASIFKPLQMKNTFVYNRRFQPRKVAHYAFGYVYSKSAKKYILPDDSPENNYVVWLDGIVGDGTVNSTVNDLLKWDRALYTNKLLSENGMKQLFEAGTLSDNSKTKYGMGFFVDDNPDFGKLANHSGGWPGYVTYIDRHLDHDKTIIALQNHEGVKVPIKSIRNILYGKPLESVKTRQEIALGLDQLQKFVGSYEVQKGFEMVISLKDNQLFTQLPGQDAFPIFAESDVLFFLKIVDAQIKFEKNEAGEIAGAMLLQNGNSVVAKRVN
ncbi:serine hydrolase [Flavobacterium selenitireducens]|uniref:serine hydrolase n=1 Tax=Flavobacterium selenitireducens TaxID=2722704 RepID=UPI00168B0111|nr:serine hydrolase [Flavobacterium selenitireducens]MBD3580995.1 serine hydrolase [Flavobacterium selenitireducens]